MEKLIEMIREYSGEGQLTTLFPLGKEHLGAHALWNGEKIIYASTNNIEWSGLEEELLSTKSTRLVEKEGQPYFLERLGRSARLVICGAGHVSMPIIKIAKLLNFHVTVLDDRLSFVGNAKEAGADEVICNSFVEGLKTVPADPNNFYIVITRGHRYDKECLHMILSRPHQYIGVMSSKTRIAILHRELKEEGESPTVVDAMYSPIGIHIQSETPEEIAVSVMAEIVQCKNEKRSTFGYPAELLDVLNSKDGKRLQHALCTIVRRRGSAPREIGSKMIVREDGTCFNTIGGGCVEAEIRGLALDVIASGVPQLATSNMTLAEAEEEGMACGGIVDILIVPIEG